MYKIEQYDKKIKMTVIQWELPQDNMNAKSITIQYNTIFVY